MSVTNPFIERENFGQGLKIITHCIHRVLGGSLISNWRAGRRTVGLTFPLKDDTSKNATHCLLLQYTGWEPKSQYGT